MLNLNRTAVGLSRASTSFSTAASKTWMAGSSPAMTRVHTIRCPSPLGERKLGAERHEPAGEDPS